ncbi:hypothetical protein ASC94_28750 [Massilia sp. Root418]|uniref:phage tail protein n=1 Tax=Massilia sp. Root418 TaxID=1736532 RepID=UPI0007018452|nr:phage tail protein [Massilia sp. Root418]KQW87375.1 hypothetical protein ASC94_28750 [Massilia sp. Root418]
MVAGDIRASEAGAFAAAGALAAAALAGATAPLPLPVADPARLLPPNSTALERALARTAPRAELGALADAPGGLRTRRPAGFAQWQAAEWQLAEFAPYFSSTGALIEQGLPWLRQRGSAASVKRALSWIGYDSTLEQQGPWLQIDPGTAQAQPQLAAIRHLVGQSLPAHARFYRMYHGYDLRPVALDFSRLDAALLDDDSGVYVDGVKLSFGTRAAAAMAPEDPPFSHGSLSTYSTRVWDDNSWRLDAFQLDSEVLVDVVGGMVSQQGYALAPEAEEAAIVSGYDGYINVMPVQDETGTQSRSDGAATAMPIEARTWTGRWAGAWREPIPNRTTFEGV